MRNLEAVLVDVRDVPELAELGKPGLKQPDWREIMIQIVLIPSSTRKWRRAPRPQCEDRCGSHRRKRP